MIHPDRRGSPLGGPHRQPSYDMVVGVVAIDDVESLLIDRARNTPDVGNDVLESEYVMRLGDRLEMKAVDPFEGILPHTLCHALPSLDRRTPIGQRYFVPPLLES